MSDKKPETKVAPNSESTAAADHTADLVAKIAKSLASEMVPALVATQLSAVQASQPKYAAPVVKSTEECTVCRQHLAACKGEHTFMVVFPKNTEYSKFFQGVFINGRKYASDHDQHSVPVPTVAAAEIGNIVRNFENNEREMMNGKQRTRMLGELGEAASNKSLAGWR